MSTGSLSLDERLRLGIEAVRAGQTQVKATPDNPGTLVVVHD